MTDTLGLLPCVVVLSTGVQDRDGAEPVPLDTSRRTGVRFVLADAGSAGRLLDWATAHGVADGTVSLTARSGG